MIAGRLSVDEKDEVPEEGSLWLEENLEEEVGDSEEVPLSLKEELTVVETASLWLEEALGVSLRLEEGDTEGLTVEVSPGLEEEVGDTEGVSLQLEEKLTVFDPEGVSLWLEEGLTVGVPL